jgi:hypothetical protein
LDQPQQFTRDAAIRGGAASAIDAGRGALLGNSGMQSDRPVADASAGPALMLDAGPPRPPPPTCVTRAFAQRCGDPSCHGAGSTKLDLVSPGVRARLLDRPSLPDLPCAGGVYIATDGAPSLMLDKLREAPSCGAPMPPSGVLKKHERDCLTQWLHSLGATDVDASELDAGAP